METNVSFIFMMFISTLNNFQLFVEKKIQVMVATATLAWGINMPAHLVIIKGTEYYDGKTHKYIDFPVTGMNLISLAYSCNSSWHEFPF